MFPAGNFAGVVWELGVSEIYNVSRLQGGKVFGKGHKVIVVKGPVCLDLLSSSSEVAEGVTR